jgi:hypothetical protein
LFPVIGAALLIAVPIHGAGLPTRASLAGLKAIGQIVVTVSGRSKGEEAALRQVVEKRLEDAAISIDPSLSTQLVVDVAGSRDTSSDGVPHFLYLITLSFQEPVRTERTRTALRATTWLSNYQVTRFGADVGLEILEDAVDGKMSQLLTTVDKDTQAAKQRPASN